MRLSEFDALIDRFTYPTSSEDIIAAHGPEELEMQNGQETVEQVFRRCGPESFTDPNEVRMTLYGSLSDDAIGRKGYTDRDPPMPGETDHVSF